MGLQSHDILILSQGSKDIGEGSILSLNGANDLVLYAARGLDDTLCIRYNGLRGSCEDRRGLWRTPKVSGGHGGGCQVSGIAGAVYSNMNQHRREAGGESEERRHDDEKEEEKMVASGEGNDGGDRWRSVSGCEICRLEEVQPFGDGDGGDAGQVMPRR